MNNPMSVWYAITAILLCAFIASAIRRHNVLDRQHRRTSKHILEIGRDKDIFFVPGDPNDDELDDL